MQDLEAGELSDVTIKCSVTMQVDAILECRADIRRGVGGGEGSAYYICSSYLQGMRLQDPRGDECDSRRIFV